MQPSLVQLPTFNLKLSLSNSHKTLERGIISTLIAELFSLQKSNFSYWLVFNWKMKNILNKVEKRRKIVENGSKLALTDIVAKKGFFWKFGQFSVK